MLLAYIDESENWTSGLRYTAATSAVFQEDDLVDFRRDLVVALNDVMFGEVHDSTKIGRLPVLHAAELPSEINDQKKIELFKIIFRLVLKYKIKIFRVGYFDESAAPIFTSRDERIASCLWNIVYPIQSIVNSSICYIYELNNSVRLKTNSYNDSYMQELIWQNDAIRRSVSIENYENIVGKFYCDKHNHHMYVADFCGYALSQRMKLNPTEFQRKIFECLTEISDFIMMDRIIYLNDHSKTRIIK